MYFQTWNWIDVLGCMRLGAGGGRVVSSMSENVKLTQLLTRMCSNVLQSGTFNAILLQIYFILTAKM